MPPAVVGENPETNTHLTPNLLINVTMEDVVDSQALKDNGYNVRTSHCADARFPKEQVLVIRDNNQNRIVSTLVVSEDTGRVYVWVPSEYVQAPEQHVAFAKRLLGLY